MRFAVLGSLDVHDAAGRSVDLSSRRQRRLLAALLIHAGSVVSDERLTEMVWDEAALPDGGVRALRTVMSRLRSTLDDGRPGRRARAHPPARIRVRTGTVPRSTPTSSRGTSTRVLERLAHGDASGSASPRSTPRCRCGGVPPTPSSPTRNGRVPKRFAWRSCGPTRSRVGSRPGWRRGAHAEVIGELERLVAAHPFREQPRVQLITALYRSGRQTEALQAYQTYRELLADELGLEPSAALQELEIADPAPRPRARAPRRRPTTVKAYALLEQVGPRRLGRGLACPAAVASIATWR